MVMSDILQVIGTGSDVAIIGFAYVLWKIERRLFAVEFKLERMSEDNG